MDYNFGQAFFIGISIFQIGTLLSAWIVARFIWLPWKEKLDDLPPLEPLYEIECVLSDEEDDQLKDYKLLKDKFIEEKTPDGKLIFRYNDDFLGFEYWADKKIAYTYMETVARKYVTKFHCTSLYIHRNEVLQELRKNSLIKKQPATDISSSNVFAVLKNYKSHKKIVAPNKANKFIYRGKFKEAPIFIKKEKPVETKNISFKDWSLSTN